MLVHLEHAHLVRARDDSSPLGTGQDHAPVLQILQLMCLMDSQILFTT
jgi:hypothetical protein